jgi:hypothetical protein
MPPGERERLVQLGPADNSMVPTINSLMERTGALNSLAWVLGWLRADPNAALRPASVMSEADSTGIPGNPRHTCGVELAWAERAH